MQEVSSCAHVSRRALCACARAHAAWTDRFCLGGVRNGRELDLVLVNVGEGGEAVAAAGGGEGRRHLPAAACGPWRWGGKGGKRNEGRGTRAGQEG